MVFRLSFLLLAALLVASCAPALSSPVPAASSPLPSAAPASVPPPTPGPPSYARSVLLARWDSQSRHHLLSPVDPATGNPLPGYSSLDLGVNYYYAFSPDHKTLAFISYQDDSASSPALHLVDLAAWQEHSYPLDLPGWVSAIAFGPDGRKLAVASIYRERDLLIFDLPSASVTAQVRPDFDITHLRFTRDGLSLMAYGRVLADRFTENERSEGPARASLLDSQDLSVSWSAELTGVLDGVYAVSAGSTDVHEPGKGRYFQPGVVFAPDADVLYIVHADQDRLTRVDFARRRFQTRDILPRLSLWERFLMLGAHTAYAKAANGVTRQTVVSPDGQLLYTTGMKNDMHQLPKGDWEYTSTGLGLQVIRLSDGAKLFQYGGSAESLKISEDGKRLYLTSSTGSASTTLPQTTLLDADTGSVIAHLEGAYAVPARRMDGDVILVSSDSLPDDPESAHMAVYDYSTGGLLAEWVGPSTAYWITEQ